MSAKYQNWLTDPDGAVLADRDGKTLLDNYLWFTITREVNKIATFEMGLPQSFDTDLLAVDNMVQFWRQPTGGIRRLWGIYFIRAWEPRIIKGRPELLISGPCINDILASRIVAEYANTSRSKKSGKADDMMKEIVTEAFSNTGNPAPTYGSRAVSGFSVQADLGAGPTIERAFAWGPLLLQSGQGVLTELHQASRAAGTEVFFEVQPATVTGTSITFEFRTFTGQPGSDVSNELVFNLDQGNLENPSLRSDFTEARNYIYSAGRGQGQDRNVQQVYDTTRIARSKWGRREGFQDANNQINTNGIREAGRVLLEEGRPKEHLAGTPLDTLGTVFGREWDFGDRVTVRYFGEERNAIIWAVTIQYRNERENIHTKLRYED